MRIVIAEDAVLLRAGLTRLLVDAGEDVVATVGDADALLEVVERLQPDLAVVDVRMPPTNTDEGLRAALTIRAGWPRVGILVLSQYVEEEYADRAASPAAPTGIGYLLKDRVADVGDFVDAVRPGGRRRHRPRPRGRRPAARPQPPARPAGPADAAGARGPGADGRGPLELRHRRGARRQRRDRREARHQHLHQAGPPAR